MSTLYELIPCELCSGGLGSGCDCDNGFLHSKKLWPESEVNELKELIQRLVNDMALGRKDVPFNTIGDIALWNGIRAAKEMGFEPEQ